MDLLSVMNQRHTEVSSELRRTHCLSAEHVVASCVALACAMVIRALRWRTAFLAHVWVVPFVMFSCFAYAASLRGLRLLNTNRFLPPPVYASPRAFSSLLSPPPRDQLSGVQRIVFSYGFSAASLLAVICGLSSAPLFVYVLLESAVFLLYIAYTVKLLRLMSPSSSVS